MTTMVSDLRFAVRALARNRSFSLVTILTLAAGAKYDVIGLSLYPTTAKWPTLSAECLANMNDLVTRYDKEVMVCEVGMDVNSPAASKAFLADIIAKTRSVPGRKGLGVFYWEPECHGNWQGYTLGAFDPSGRPTIAMDAFKE